MEMPHDKYSSNLWDWLTNGQTTHHIRKRSIGSVVYKIWPFLLTLGEPIPTKWSPDLSPEPLAFSPLLFGSGLSGLMWTLLGISSYVAMMVGIAELNRQAQQGMLHTTLGPETTTVP